MFGRLSPGRSPDPSSGSTCFLNYQNLNKSPPKTTKGYASVQNTFHKVKRITLEPDFESNSNKNSSNKKANCDEKRKHKFVWNAPQNMKNQQRHQYF